MKKNKILKMVILIITLVACISTTVLAAEDVPTLDFQFGNTTGGNTTDGNTTGGNTTDGNTTGGNTTGGNTTGGNTTGGNTTGGNNTAGNTSTYEDGDMPYAGPAESILMAGAFVVCAIIGGYTFMKLSDYSNI